MTDVIVVNTRGARGIQGPVGTAINGTNGTNGTDGSAVLYYSNVETTNATASYASLNSYSIALGQLTSIGSSITAETVIDCDILTGVKEIEVQLDGTTCHTGIPSFTMQEGVKTVMLGVKVTYTSAVLVDVKIKVMKFDDHGLELHGQGLFEKSFTVSDMSANANLLDIRGKASAAADIIRGQEIEVTYKKL
jgi:hypothetical protein